VSAHIRLVGATDRYIEDMLTQFGLTVTASSGAELANLAHPSAKQPDVLVIDLRSQTHLPAALPVLKRQHPTTGVIIVASKLEATLMLEAMRAGVNECVTEPIAPADLEAAIARIMAQKPMPASSGAVMAMLGAKGGVGTTTVAVNVAAAIARLGRSTILVDLHLANGDAAVFLGVEPKFSVLDALENTHRLDESFLRGLITKTKAGTDLLASSDRAMVSPVDVRRIRTVVEAASRIYEYVVLDVPRSDASVLDALETAEKVFIIANQELATVRNASRMLVALRQRYGSDRPEVVLTRSDRLAEIGHEDVERAVGGPVKHTFPSDYRLALQALNSGRPLVTTGDSELALALQRFAHLLAGVSSKQKTATEKSPRLLNRLIGRR
jgi:pilus assembly protein CpaE